MLTIFLVQTIMLLLGGFAIASAFTKHSIARRFAVWALSRISTRPHVVLLASMFLATITSMFITNVAAPVLCFSVLDPILRTLPSGHSFGKALVLGNPPCALFSPIFKLWSACAILGSLGRRQAWNTFAGIVLCKTRFGLDLSEELSMQLGGCPALLLWQLAPKYLLVSSLMRVAPENLPEKHKGAGALLFAAHGRFFYLE